MEGAAPDAAEKHDANFRVAGALLRPPVAVAGHVAHPPLLALQRPGLRLGRAVSVARGAQVAANGDGVVEPDEFQHLVECCQKWDPSLEVDVDLTFRYIDRDSSGSVEVANVMVYSGLLGQAVDLPMDSAAWESKLNELIANSTHEKKTVEVSNEDFSASFRK